MKNHALLPVPSAVAAGSTATLARFRLPLTTGGFITRAAVVSEAANEAGDAVFDVRIEGVSIFAEPEDRLILAEGSLDDSTTAIDGGAVSYLELVEVVAVTIPAGGFAADALSLVVEIDDGIALPTTLAGDVAGALGANVVEALRGKPLPNVTGPLLHYRFNLGEFVWGNAQFPPAELIDDLFRGALARPPSGPEAAAALALLDAAANAAQIIAAAVAVADDLFTSAEYLARGRSDAQFVADLYAAFLARAGESPQLENYIALVPTLGRDTVRAQFSGSVEFQSIRIPYFYPSAIAGGLQSRGEVEITTAAIADGASELDSAEFGRSFLLHRLALDFAARVRLYATADARDDDLARVAGVDPAEGSQVADALLLDLLLDGETGLEWILGRDTGANGDEPASALVYYTITNLSGASRAITATITRTILEA